MGDQRVDGSVTCIKTTESCLKFNQAVERCYGLRLCSVGIRMLTQHATCISKLRFTQGVNAKMTLNSENCGWRLRNVGISIQPQL